MSVRILLKYSGDFRDLNSQDEHLVGPLSDRVPDFICDSTRWYDTALNIETVITHIVIFPLAIRESVRYLAQRVILMALYPAQSRIVKRFVGEYFSATAIDSFRQREATTLRDERYIFRHVSLMKNGVRFSGLLVGHQSTISNGNWVLQATGNMEFAEHSILDIAKEYSKAKFNTLIVNGPNVGRSEGHATTKSMAQAQEVGLQFIETALKAKNIAIAGRSLGGAAIGMMIMKHDFLEEKKYLVIRQMTFDRASNICARLAGTIFGQWIVPYASGLVKWCGLEMDSIAASQMLRDKGIKEVIIQATNRWPEETTPVKKEHFQTDGPIIAEASLGYGLCEEGVLEDKKFVYLKGADHMTSDAILDAREEISMHFSS